MENIYDYFTRLLGKSPEDKTLRELPVDSGCGDDCKRAIDAAQILIGAARNAGNANNAVKSIIAITDDAVRVYWRG